MLSVQQNIPFEGSPEINTARVATHRPVKSTASKANGKQIKTKLKNCEKAAVVNKFDFVGVAG
ncbi:MAG: hypothetical protein ACI9FR_003286 [Cryomorphaceae bacterium]|jgi:hypothetical protein